MLLDDLEKDFEWYTRDPEGYRAEEDRRWAVINAACKKYMGSEFEKEPLMTAEEVQEWIKERSARLAALQALKAPKLLLDNEQRMLEEVLTVYQEGKYALTKEELDYKERYWKKYNEFFSQEHKWDWE